VLTVTVSMNFRNFEYTCFWKDNWDEFIKQLKHVVKMCHDRHGFVQSHLASCEMERAVCIDFVQIVYCLCIDCVLIVY
jgi:hypothetical protein